MFFENQPQKQKQDYISNLKLIGSLSNLFSSSEIPYLYYRSAENIFCRALKANNLSRGDITFDATKDIFGIALKTFQHRNGQCVEKIAEFNSAIKDFSGKSDEEIMVLISQLRNNRIDVAIRLTNVKFMLYHLITRKQQLFEVHEEPLEYISIKNLKIDHSATTTTAIWFTDGKHEYKFSKSKSTLYKRFITNKPVTTFNVDILDDPYSFLEQNGVNSTDLFQNIIQEQYEQVTLPLYSAKHKQVKEKSGLNQWNAGGRDRHENEIYIPIPAWIHKVFDGFFPYDYRTDKKEAFELILPNERKLSAKICQTGGKGFMSNPNKELGTWLLRHVLKIPLNKLITDEDLKIAGIDSVIVTKLEKLVFRIDFASIGTYEEFEENNKYKV